MPLFNHDKVHITSWTSRMMGMKYFYISHHILSSLSTYLFEITILNPILGAIGNVLKVIPEIACTNFDSSSLECVIYWTIIQFKYKFSQYEVYIGSIKSHVHLMIHRPSGFSFRTTYFPFTIELYSKTSIRRYHHFIWWLG